jgi:hypothetical protein
MIVIDDRGDFFKLLREMRDGEDHRERSAQVILDEETTHATVKHPQMGWVHCYEIAKEDLDEEGIEFYKGRTKGER